MTGQNLPSADGFERRLAIILDGEVYPAPAIHAQISSNGIITGHFTQREVDDLVAVLNAGSLPATLVKTPISESSVGPTLGQDTIRDGLLSVAISTAVVLIFMAAYLPCGGAGSRPGRALERVHGRRHHGLAARHVDLGGLAAWRDRGHGGRYERAHLRASARSSSAANRSPGRSTMPSATPSA